MTGADRASTGGEAGFTLIETVTALAILAIALTSLMASFGNGLRVSHAGTRADEARRLAENLMARTEARSGRLPSVESGTADGLRWRVTALPQAPVDQTGARRWTLHRITVDVGWDARGTHRIETMKLVGEAE